MALALALASPPMDPRSFDNPSSPAAHHSPSAHQRNSQHSPMLASTPRSPSGSPPYPQGPQHFPSHQAPPWGVYPPGGTGYFGAFPPGAQNPALFFQQQQWAAAAAYHQQQLMMQQAFAPQNPDFGGRRRTSSGPQHPSSASPYLESGWGGAGAVYPAGGAMHCAFTAAASDHGLPPPQRPAQSVRSVSADHGGSHRRSRSVDAASILRDDTGPHARPNPPFRKGSSGSVSSEGTARSGMYREPAGGASSTSVDSSDHRRRSVSHVSESRPSRTSLYGTGDSPRGTVPPTLSPYPSFAPAASLSSDFIPPPPRTHDRQSSFSSNHSSRPPSHHSHSSDRNATPTPSSTQVYPGQQRVPGSSTSVSSQNSSNAPSPTGATPRSGLPTRQSKPSPLSQQQMLAEERPASPALKDGKGGLKSRLKRALSSSSALANGATDDSAIGRSSSSPSTASKSRPSTSAHRINHSASSHDTNGSSRSTSPPQTPPNDTSPRPRADSGAAPSDAPPKKHSIFNSKFNMSTDNISISSAASSASVMIRKIGSMGKLARRHSLISLTNLFKDKDKDKDGAGGEFPIGHEADERESKEKDKKKKKKDKKSKKGGATSSVSHATAEVDRDASGSFGGLSPAAAFVKQHQAAQAAAEQQQQSAAPSSLSPGMLQGSLRRGPSTGDVGGASAAWDADETPRPSVDGEVAPYQPESDDDDEPIFLQPPAQEWNGPVDLGVGSHRRTYQLRGILKAAGSYRQEDFEERPEMRGRSNSYSSVGTLQQASNAHAMAHIPPPDPDHIDGLSTASGAAKGSLDLDLSLPSISSEPFSFSYANTGANSSAPSLPLGDATNAAATSAPVSRTATSSPAVGAGKKRCTFAANMSIQTTWPSNVYDRRGEPATCNRLTPELAQMIKEELNTYKMEEMRVHAQSRVHTHFFL